MYIACYLLPGPTTFQPPEPLQFDLRHASLSGFRLGWYNVSGTLLVPI